MAEKFQRSPEGRGDYSEADALLPDGEREKRMGLTDEQLAVIISAQEHSSTSFVNSRLANDRAQAMKYYLGEPFGNEVEGRSQVISKDVFEAVEGMLPALLEIFLASNRLAECEPNGPEDELEAKQQSEVANYIVMKQNNAALIFYTWFKDALIQKVGVVKTYYEEEDEYRIEQYKALTEEELVKIASDENVEPLEVVQYSVTLMGPQGQVQVPVSDLKARVRTKRQKVCIKNIPPENFLISTRQSSLDLNECEFCSHKELKTITDLLEMGVPQEFLDDVGEEDSPIEISPESIVRENYNDTLSRDAGHDDPSMREIWTSDVYMVIDADGDGVGELRHIIKIGNKVWVNEETDMIPFSAVCPIILPHQFFGMSVADITADVQMNKSVLLRQMHDNLYLTNNPRNMVLENQVDMDDLLTSRPGGIVRMKIPGAVTPMVVPFVAKESFPMLEYWESMRENRTGVTRYNQGTDADSLNKTARGINAIMGASMKRLEMVARLFAETGVKDLVRKVLGCVAKSGMKQVIVKLTNGYVSIDPREWKNQYNITINVGLGTGNKDRTIQMLSMLSAKQLELKQTGRGYMISEQNDYNMAAKLAEAAGYKSPEVFFTDPKAVPPQAKQAPPPIEMLKLEQDGKLKVADMQVTSQQKDKDMANDRYIEEMKAKIGQQTDIAVAEIDSKTKLAIAQLESDTQRRAKMADGVLKDHELRGKAELEVFHAANERDKNMEQVQSMEGAMKGSMNEGMQKLIDAITSGNDRIVSAIEQQSEKIEGLKQTMLAPRKRIKDKSGKTIGIEIDGQTVSVQ